MSILLEEKARIFATAAHAAIRQVRKYTGEPYIVHPAAVVAIVKSVPHTPEMVAAAWLHDVVEDTGVQPALIHSEFGPVVAGHVSDLTDVSKPEDGKREQRKAIDRAHSAEGSAGSQTLKLADLIENSSSIVGRGGDFARIYLREKALLLEVLTKGDPTLHARATAILNDALARLQQMDAR